MRKAGKFWGHLNCPSSTQFKHKMASNIELCHKLDNMGDKLAEMLSIFTKKFVCLESKLENVESRIANQATFGEAGANLEREFNSWLVETMPNLFDSALKKTYPWLLEIR